MNKNMILVMLHHHGLYDASFHQSQIISNGLYNHCFMFRELYFSISNVEPGSIEENGGEICPVRFLILDYNQYSEVDSFKELIQYLKNPKEIPWIELDNALLLLEA